MRWGIEVSFRTLKYTIGLLHFHSKKPEYILQEIFARLTMYNFTAFIAAGVPPKKPKDNRKHKYKVNFSVATGICRKFFLGLCTPETVEAVIRRHILPIRPNKHKPRKPRHERQCGYHLLYGCKAYQHRRFSFVPGAQVFVHRVRVGRSQR